MSSLLLLPPILRSRYLLHKSLVKLARNPDMQETLRAELRSALGEKEGGQLVNSLPYLDAFVSEVFRRHPSVTELTREVCVVCDLHNYSNLLTLLIFRFRRPSSTTSSHLPTPPPSHPESPPAAPPPEIFASPSLVLTDHRRCGGRTRISLT